MADTFMAFLSFFFFLFFSLPLFSSFTEAQPSVVDGLSWEFYNQSCPSLEHIVRAELATAFMSDIGLAAALLRIHFHDCFVQGCDASVLNGLEEQNAPPNLSLRRAALQLINDIHNQTISLCGRVVSCSDVTALAARDSVFLSGGPDYRVPLGRRDSLNFASRDDTLNNLPFFGSPVPVLEASFSNKSLNITDLVALSGAHTIGISSCSSFTNRLYPTRESNRTLDPSFAGNLRATCPANDTRNSTFLDIISPNLFDNGYFRDLVNLRGLLTSDQDLFTNETTRPIVESFANNQSLFFEQFAISMVKMGQFGVLTGDQGEIRQNCSAPSSTTTPSTISMLTMDQFGIPYLRVEE